MTHIKVNKRWYHLESLTDHDKTKLGILPEIELDEKVIKEELSKVPESVKKNHVKSTKDNNIKSKKVVIGSPSLKENKKK